MDTTEVRYTYIGGPTALIEIGPWRLLTDPTFDPPGKRYFFGWGTMSRKLQAPAIPFEDLGPIDAVLISHDHHGDNLDPAGRALLPRMGTIVTTHSGARRLGGDARGLQPWGSTTLDAPGRTPIEITATPCRHGPPGSHAIVGDVIGFALRWEGQRHGVLWISGDTVLYDGVRQVARRLDVATAIVHLGGVRFPISGPLRYTMTGADAAELCELLDPQAIVPLHFEGWKHFREPRAAAARALASSAIGERVRWPTAGESIELAV
jgi:L-ascorbate metabolism protein UlaG (beta-lactamase superfamily)